MFLGCYGDLSWCLTPARRPSAPCWGTVSFHPWLALSDCFNSHLPEVCCVLL
jgi:hypothetical protein